MSCMYQSFLSSFRRQLTPSLVAWFLKNPKTPSPHHTLPPVRKGPFPQRAPRPEARPRAEAASEAAIEAAEGSKTLRCVIQDPTMPFGWVIGTQTGPGGKHPPPVL